MLFPLLHRFVTPFVSPILLYHSILPDEKNEMGETVHNVTPQNFEKQILWLKRHYDVISVDEFFVLEDCTGKACITFDDAYKSVFDYAVPLLVKHKLPATVFINASTFEGQVFWRDKVRFIINENLVESFLHYRAKKWPEVEHIEAQDFYRVSKANTFNSQEIINQIDEFIVEQRLGEKVEKLKGYIASFGGLSESSLVTYGNHSLDHYVMSSLTDAEQEQQISENKRRLETYNIPLSNIFSVPFGGQKDMNNFTVKAIQGNGYNGFLYSRNLVNMPKRQDNFTAERFMPDNIMKLFHKRLVGATLRSLRYSLKANGLLPPDNSKKEGA